MGTTKNEQTTDVVAKTASSTGHSTDYKYGKDQVIYLKDDATGSWASDILECQGESNIDISNALQDIEIICKDASMGADAKAQYTQAIDGKRSWTLPFNFTALKDPASAVVQERIKNKITTAADTRLKMLFGSFGGTAEAPTFSGWAGYVRISDLSESAPAESVVAASGTLTGVGEVKSFTSAGAADINAFFGLTA